MAWLLLLAAFAPLVAVLLARTARRWQARRGWARWRQQQRSGALAWTLFRRRPRQPRLTDQREP